MGELADEIKIIHEEAEFLLLDKPAGWVTTSEGVGVVESLENWLRLRKKIDLPRAGLVHRLDKGTSGLVLVAKNQASLINLQKQFKQRTVIKIYWALVEGEAVATGQIEMPIKRSVFSKFAVDPDGRMAISRFVRIEKYKMEGRNYSLMEVRLMTGRTHQIRVHFSYLGWPLAGDRVYGGKILLGMNRPFLHAKSLGFRHPVGGEFLNFESPIPDELKKILSFNEEK